jgi:hypothetical protein
MVSPSFFVRHRPSRDRVSPAIRESNDDTEQVTTSLRLTQDVIEGIAPFGFGTLDKRLAEADLFNLFGGDIMLCNVVYSVFWPGKLMDSHVSILRQDLYPANETLPANAGIQRRERWRASAAMPGWASLPLVEVTDNPGAAGRPS